jgi:hypothetical protein
METVTAGLGIYAKIRAWGGLFILILIFISAIYCTFSSYDKYELAKNGQTTYKQRVGDDEYEECNPTDLNNADCLFYTEYDDNDDNHRMIAIQDPDKTKRTVGDTPIYYDKNNTNSYVNSPIDPFNIASGISCIICILIIIAIINLYLLLSYDGYAAVQGGVEAASNVAAIFNKK